MTLTATDNTPNGTTNISIAVEDDTISPYVVFSCDQGPKIGQNTCSGNVTSTTAGQHSYVGIAEDETNSQTVAQTAVTSGRVTVNYEDFAPKLYLDSSVLHTGQTTTLTATTAVDIGPTPYSMNLYDVTSGSPVLKTTCASGSTCSVPVNETSSGTYSFEAILTKSYNDHDPSSDTVDVAQGQRADSSGPNGTTQVPGTWVTLPAGGSRPGVTSNWSGYIADSSSSPAFSVSGGWVQAGADSKSASNADETTWVGLGGDNDGSLLQNGTDIRVSDKRIFSWYEALHPCTYTNEQCSEPEQPTQELAVGDTVEATTSWDPASNTASFKIEDNGMTVQNVTMQMDASFYDGSTAEFINERPSFGGPQPYHPLAGYGHEDWGSSASPDQATSDKFTSAAGSQVLTPANSNAVTMTNGPEPASACGDPDVLAVAGSLNLQGHFTSTWCQAGP